MAEIDIRSLPLHDLVSAPLTAAVEAQQQASLGVVSFIRDVGFEGEDEASQPRMLTFRFSRAARDVDGDVVERETQLRIPLLSMVSIPVLEIDTLTVNVLVGVQGATVTETSPKVVPEVLRERYPFLRGRSALRVQPAARTIVKGNTQTSRPYDLEITMTASGQEPTDGIDRLLTSLSALVTEDSE